MSLDDKAYIKSTIEKGIEIEKELLSKIPKGATAEASREINDEKHGNFILELRPRHDSYHFYARHKMYDYKSKEEVDSTYRLSLADIPAFEYASFNRYTEAALFIDYKETMEDMVKEIIEKTPKEKLLNQEDSNKKERYVVIEQQNLNGYFKYHLLSEEEYNLDRANGGWNHYKFVPHWFDSYENAKEYVNEMEERYVVYYDREQDKYGLCKYYMAENLYQNSLYYKVLYVDSYEDCVEYLKEKEGINEDLTNEQQANNTIDDLLKKQKPNNRLSL